ncbi:MAG: hypothetical protein AAF513_05455 [Pseudomonadota bacterium]
MAKSPSFGCYYLGMRPVYLLITLALIAAVGAPFYLKGPSGQSLFDVDQFFATPELPMPAKPVYKWQDAQGVWQFGDEPPAGVMAQEVAIRPNMPPIKTDWAAQLEAREAAAAAAAAAEAPAEDASGKPGLGDVYGPQAIEQAEAAARLMDDHHAQLEEVMKLTQGKK